MERKRRILTGRTLLYAVCLPLLARSATAQTIVRSFDGDSGPGLAVCESGITHCDRPEMDVAVNGKQVVQGDDRADEKRQHADHQQAGVADFKELLENFLPLPPRVRQSQQRAPEQQNDFSDIFKHGWCAVYFRGGSVWKTVK